MGRIRNGGGAPWIPAGQGDDTAISRGPGVVRQQRLQRRKVAGRLIRTIGQDRKQGQGPVGLRILRRTLQLLFRLAADL